MRLAYILSLSMLALATVPVVATATLDHPGCGTSDATIPPNGAVKVEVWTTNCTGAVVWMPLIAECADNVHEDVLGVHVLVLHDGGCQTGVLVQP